MKTRALQLFRTPQPKLARTPPRTVPSRKKYGRAGFQPGGGSGDKFEMEGGSFAHVQTLGVDGAEDGGGEQSQVGLMADEQEGSERVEGLEVMDGFLGSHPGSRPRARQTLEVKSGGDGFGGLPGPHGGAGEDDGGLAAIGSKPASEGLGLLEALGGKWTLQIRRGVQFRVRVPEEQPVHGGAPGSGVFYITMPPSTVRHWPVMYLAS